ncbi:unnamed protein product [Ectocarpus sp. 12 AP-2014]
MLNVHTKICGHAGCMKWASYGETGSSNKAEFCKRHAKQGMVDVASKKCGHPGCMNGPSCGETGSKKAEVYKRHTKQGMVDVASKKCGHPGCTSARSFAWKTATSATSARGTRREE